LGACGGHYLPAQINATSQIYEMESGAGRAQRLFFKKGKFQKRQAVFA